MSARLIEIRCSEFRKNGIPRPPVRFHAGLNAVLGDDSGSNSIGKSTLLMIIDFAFGGNDYIDKLKDVQQEFPGHIIQFAFEWGGKRHCFSRSTVNKAEVDICDEEYNIIETISTDKFCQMLFEAYELRLPSITFRNIVGRYFRIRKRGNLDETHPLLAVTREKDADAITALIKLFDRYSLIAEYEQKKKASEEKDKAFRAAQKYELIPKITKKQYEANLRRIDELTAQLASLSQRSTEKLLEAEAEEAAAQSQTRSECTYAKRQRTRLQSRLTSIEKDIAGDAPFDDLDLADLAYFFPGIDIKPIQTVSTFHENLRTVLNDEFRTERESLRAMIALLDGQIAQMETAMMKSGELVKVPKRVLDEYATLRSEIDKLVALNGRYDESVDLKERKKTLAADLIESKGSQTRILQNDINNEMRNINEYIQEGRVVPPVLTFKDDASGYHFETPKDGGTGTAFIGLIDFDLSILRMTALPALIHDSFVFKQISVESVERIMKLYAEQTDKQIFIEFDRVASYTPATAALLRSPEVKVIELSKNEPLFGRSWNNDEDAGAQ
jgi:uncharacterized protein YydD (DUF2326 family)